jgi:predicted DNA-binding transcriptional regulator AlpA
MSQLNANPAAPAAALPKLLKATEAAQLLGVSRSTFHKAVDAGTYPQPIRVTPRRPVWRERELIDFVNSL